MSKNMFSFQNEYVPIEDNDYHDALAARLGKLSKERLDDVLLWVSESNLDVQFQLVAKLVPLSMDDTVTLLEDARLYFQEGNELLDTNAQARLAFVVEPLLENVRGKIRAGQLLRGACICFAIIRALEPLTTSVSDEGALLQRFITDAFKVLQALTKEEGDRQTFSFVALLAESQFRETLEDDRHYEEEWEGLIKQYRSRVQNYVRS